MSNTTPSPAPIAVGPGEGEALWFVGTLAIVKASGATTGGRMAVVDQLACLLYTSPSPRDLSTSRMPSSA